MDLTAVFLDAGGVILDETEHEQIRAKIAVELLGSVLPGYALKDYWADVAEAVRTFCPEVYQFVFWKHLKQNEPLFRDLYREQTELWQQRRSPLILLDGLEQEVRGLSENFKIGIAGQYGAEILALLEERGLLDCFAYRVTQDDFRITKPDPRYFEQILATGKVDPGAAVMVGDRIDKDVIPARQVGMKTVLVRRGIHRDQQPRTPLEGPDVALNGIIGLAVAVSRLSQV